MTNYTEPKRPEDMIVDELVARVHALEAALFPFATIGVAFGEARMNLIAAGRGSEPAGGHWTNHVKSSALAPSEPYFYQALDVRGRQNTHDMLMANMATADALTTTTNEKVKTVDSGGRVDH